MLCPLASFSSNFLSERGESARLESARGNPAGETRRRRRRESARRAAVTGCSANAHAVADSPRRGQAGARRSCQWAQPPPGAAPHVRLGQAEHGATEYGRRYLSAS